jgi:hypothetical protein
MTDPSSYSCYNALEVSLEHELAANLAMQFSYTDWHWLDTGPRRALQYIQSRALRSTVVDPLECRHCGFPERHRQSDHFHRG